MPARSNAPKRSRSTKTRRRKVGRDTLHAAMAVHSRQLLTEDPKGPRRKPTLAPIAALREPDKNGGAR